MTYPDKVKIAGVDYDILYETTSSSLQRNLYGCIIYAAAEIHIDGTQKDQFIRKVLLHEIIHGVSDAFSANLTEEQTVAMENGLWQLFKDNPNLHSQLFAPV